MITGVESEFLTFFIEGLVVYGCRVVVIRFIVAPPTGRPVLLCYECEFNKF